MSVAADIFAHWQRQLHRHIIATQLLAWSPVLLLCFFDWRFVAIYAAVLAVSVPMTIAHAKRHFTKNLNQCFAELEDSAELLSATGLNGLQRLQHNRLQVRLATIDRRVFTRRFAAIDLSQVSAALCLTLLLTTWQISNNQPSIHRDVSIDSAASLPPSVNITVTPPSYTGLGITQHSAAALRVPEGSLVRWCTSAKKMAIRSSEGHHWPLHSACTQQTLTQSISWRWHNEQEHSSWYTLEVIPDQAPLIQFEAPRDILQTLSEKARHVDLKININDDYGISRASLHMTLARGSGENVRFSNREWPIAQSTAKQQRVFDKRFSLNELGMEPGDELYLFVRASDNASQTQTTQSPSYTIRLPGPPSESVDSSALPSLAKPESLRSQRQIIVDTEQLISDWKALSAAQQQLRSSTIANDQAALRRRFGEFLGEESSLFGDEHDSDNDSGQLDVLHQFGHAHDGTENATLFDEKTKTILRRALAAMWEAEKELRLLAPKPALPSEYRALDAIKELQRAERIYLHRTAFAPPPLKEEYRLQAERDGISSKIWLALTQNSETAISQADMMQALHDGKLPLNWQSQIGQWFAQHEWDDKTRLQALQTLREFEDGCTNCQPALRAYIRQTVANPSLRWQAGTQFDGGVQP